MLYTKDYIINSAELGECNPLPDIKNVSYIHAGFEATDRVTEEERKYMGKGMISTILPYKLQDGYNRDRKPRTYKAICIENEFLCATVLPELGGRLWSLYDKKAERELLYKNSVFQPANLALRNAWFSGGVEFNVGIKGHNPLTCSPLFAEISEYPDGSAVLKMYEFERIREITYSISMYLPENSPVLYIHNKIENTSDDEKYGYWWSNIAVDETEKTRVIAPADESFLSSYNDGHYIMDKIQIPFFEGKDLSYPSNSVRSQDFFYKIPQNEAKWIAAVHEDGYGLLQLSDSKMIGRKLFVWGKGAGGRHWGEWLSEKGSSYIEIQAGLAHTQLEHFPMSAHSSIEWTEGYCAVSCNSEEAHSTDWHTAQNAVKKAYYGRLEAETVEIQLSNIFPKEGTECKTELVCNGSGWGALENTVRKYEGKQPVSKSCAFPKESLTREQEIWLHLLENGELPYASADAEPVSYVSGRAWRPLLEAAAEKNNEQTWLALLQLGIHYYIYGENEKAKNAWENSLATRESAWARRNLALLLKNEYYDIDAAITHIRKAVKLNNSCRGLLVDCAKLFTDNGLDAEWLEIYESLSDKLKNDGRIRLFKAIAHMNLGEILAACEIINEKFEMCDIQEGEVSVSHIWQKLYGMKLKRETGITEENELKRLTDELYPLPYSLDFRMHE